MKKLPLIWYGFVIGGSLSSAISFEMSKKIRETSFDSAKKEILQLGEPITNIRNEVSKLPNGANISQNSIDTNYILVPYSQLKKLKY